MVPPVGDAGQAVQVRGGRGQGQVNIDWSIWFITNELSCRVYGVGGFNGSLRVRTVDMYDPTADSWSSIASMEARRSTLGVAVMNDHIYAVGGFDGSCGLNTAEVLDMSVSGTHEWRTIASMSTRRSSVGVGVLCGLIYAVGGYDGNSRQCLASVEVYNPEQDIWSPVADMSARRSVRTC